MYIFLDMINSRNYFIHWYYMSRQASFGKSLKGAGSLSARLSQPLEDSILEAISNGGIPLENVNITGGTINGVVIGDQQPGPGDFTTLQTGDPAGQGYTVCFYGQTIGDSACWEPVIGRWNIQGDLISRDISDLGNLRLAVNSISASNTNGGINLIPNGTGIVNILGPLNQTTTDGDITLNTTNGLYSLDAGDTISSISGGKTNILTENGSITLDTGTGVVSHNITSITSGSTTVITTTTEHNFETGDIIKISLTDSVPIIDGEYTVTDVPSTTTFQVDTLVTTDGTSGEVRFKNDINLSAYDDVNIPEAIDLRFGDTCRKIYGDTLKNLNIESCEGDINITPSIGYTVNIPDDIKLTFGDDTRNIQGDSVSGNLLINAGTGDVVIDNNRTVINGDLLVNGDTTYIKSNIVAIEDPIFTLGGTEPPVVSDTRDRGVEYRYYDGEAKIGYFGKDTSTGCFTYIPDATNTGEIFAGDPGCASFGDLSVTSLDLQSGNVTNIGTLNTCNLSCTDPGGMTVSSTDGIMITTTGLVIDSQVSILDPLISIGDTVDDNKDRGISFNYYDGGNKTGFIGWDSSTDCFRVMKDTMVVDDEIVSGTDSDVCLGDTTVNDLTINGNVTGLMKTEHLSVIGGGSVSPSSDINITFITVSSSGTATGTLLPPTEDGFQKYVFVSSLIDNGIYSLSCPSGRLIDPGSGTSASKTIKFTTTGQSVFMIWDNITSAYMFVNGGACIE